MGHIKAYQINTYMDIEADVSRTITGHFINYFLCVYGVRTVTENHFIEPFCDVLNSF